MVLGVYGFFRCREIDSITEDWLGQMGGRLFLWAVTCRQMPNGRSFVLCSLSGWAAFCSQTFKLVWQYFVVFKVEMGGQSASRLFKIMVDENIFIAGLEGRR